MCCDGKIFVKMVWLGARPYPKEGVGVNLLRASCLFQPVG